MVNDLRDEGKRRVESDRHSTLTLADSSMYLFLTYLIHYADDYPGETDTWGIINRSATMCTGEVTQWRDPATLSIRRLGGRWAHLQILAYAIAYPTLMDEITSAVATVQRQSAPGLADPGPHPARRP